MWVPAGSQGDDFKAKARQSGEGCADWVPTFVFCFFLKYRSFQIDWSWHLREILRSSFDVSPRRCEELPAAPDAAHPTTGWHHVCVSQCICVFVGCELFEVQRTCSMDTMYVFHIVFVFVYNVWGAKDLFQGVLHTVHVSGEGGKYGENLPDLLLRFNFRLQGGSLADLHPDTKVIFKPWVCPIPKAKMILCVSGKRLRQAQIKYVWVILNLQIKKGKKSPI